ncbi:MAG TPA: class I SAM-dependent methyltransferase [Solirubrobacteraceae bacterium]|nr:class I SAM-dependent methyltransferase [Solirubrobacteraceae bacterium]
MTAGGSSIPEVQALLATLVAAKPDGRIAELGTAFGEGALAIVAALGPAASFVTVESDRERFAAASAALAGTRAETLNARWEDVLGERGPFDLIFFDGGTRGETIELAIGLLAPGGIIVKDDLTPGVPVRGDAVREALMLDPRLAAVELAVRDDMAVIVATRRSA